MGGDLLVRGLWSKGKYCVIDVRITDINNKTQRNTRPESVLKKHENEKKNKYLKACTEYCRDFTPFVLSTEGLLGREAKALLKHIAKLIAEKWDRPFSIISSYVKHALVLLSPELNTNVSEVHAPQPRLTVHLSGKTVQVLDTSEETINSIFQT